MISIEERTLQVYTTMMSGHSSKYIPIRLLGAGAQGCVFLAGGHQGDEFAIKFRHYNNINDYYHRKILNENVVHLQLSHPYIAKYCEVLQNESEMINALVLEKYDYSLDQYISDNFYSEDLVWEVGGQLAEALTYIHSCGIIHRDVKPENVLLTSTLEVKLSDFGLSRCVSDPDRQHSLSGQTGTFPYMSPEMYDHQAYDGSTDVYSLGVLLFEMVSKERPFEPTTKQVRVYQEEDGNASQDIEEASEELRQKLKKLNHVPRERMGCSEKLKDLISSMLEPQPQDRIQLQKILNNKLIMHALISRKNRTRTEQDDRLDKLQNQICTVEAENNHLKLLLEKQH